MKTVEIVTYYDLDDVGVGEWTCPDCNHENYEFYDMLEGETVFCEKCKHEFMPAESKA